MGFCSLVVAGVLLAGLQAELPCSTGSPQAGLDWRGFLLMGMAESRGRKRRCFSVGAELRLVHS